ncbi:hypothetical protein [Alteromonas facilis]|uniref:hypothetical protein n=1 Tax=Alteromonas facilis TaxID=2048004 RepID=UPI000C283EEC|nr:hypothetical protein [Alteromonas facilis]
MQNQTSCRFVVVRKLSMLLGLSLLINGQVLASDQVTMSELQMLAQERLTELYGDDAPTSYPSSSVRKWLASPLTLDFTALRSDQSEGSDELELALRAEINNPTAMQLNADVSEITQSLQAAMEQKSQLFYAGLVRRLVWERLAAESEVAALNQKLAWIERFGDDLTRRVNAEEASRFTLLQWQQQRLQIRSDLLTAQANVQAITKQYKDILGTETLPTNPIEAVVEPARLPLPPELHIATLQYQLGQKAFDLSKASAAPWQVGFIVKQLKTSGFDEKQIGLTVGVPLSIGGSVDVVTSAEWELARQSLQNNWIEQRLAYQQQHDAANAEMAILKQQLALLEEQVALGEDVISRLDQLQKTSELEQSAWLQERLRQMDLRQALDRLALSAHQQQAKINQILGIQL